MHNLIMKKIKKFVQSRYLKRNQNKDKVSAKFEPVRFQMKKNHPVKFIKNKIIRRIKLMKVIKNLLIKIINYLAIYLL